MSGSRACHFAVSVFFISIVNTKTPSLRSSARLHKTEFICTVTESDKRLTCGVDRILRKRVYETNYSNIEKILLEKLNTAKTIRLVLRNGASDDGELTQDLQELYREAPSLFRSVLSETDRARIADDDDETEFELAVDQSTNDTHIEPSVISRMPQKEVKAIRHTANEDMMLPVRAGSLSDTFQGLLRSAYEDDYGFPAGTPVVLGNAPIQWSRKFAFVDG